MIGSLGEGGPVVSSLRRVGCYGMIVRRQCLRHGQKEGRAV